MAGGQELKAVLSLAGQVDPSLQKAMKQAAKEAAALGKEGGGIGSAFAKAGKIAGAALATVGTAVVAAGAKAITELVNLGTEFDNAYDTIRIGTGATGDTLDGLTDSFKAVYSSVPTEMEQASQAIADYNTRLGLTGDTLEGVSKQAIQVSDLFDQDLGSVIEESSQAFQAWDVQANEMTRAMDYVFKASQSTGTGFSDLLQQVQANAPALQELDYGFEESIALLGQMDKSGLNASETLAALKKSTSVFAKEGLSSAEGLAKYSAEIQNAASQSEGLALTAQIFGTRAAPTMFKAIKEGALDASGLAAELSGMDESIAKAAEDTYDFGERWQLFKQNMQVKLEPLAMAAFEQIKEVLPQILDSAGAVIDSVLPELMVVFSDVLSELAELVTEFLPDLARLAGELLPVLSGAFKDLMPAIMSIARTALPVLSQLISQLAPIIASLLTQLAPLVSMLLEMAMQVIAPLLPMLGELLGTLLPPLIGLISGIMSAMAPFIPMLMQLVMSVIQPLVPMLAMLAQALLPPLMQILDTIFNQVLMPLMPVLMTLVQAVMPILMVVLQAIMPILQALSPVISFIGDVLSVIMQVIAKIIEFVANGIGKVVDFFTGIFGGAKDAAQATSELGDSMNNLPTGGGEFAMPEITMPEFDANAFNVDIPPIDTTAYTGSIDTATSYAMTQVPEIGDAFTDATQTVTTESQNMATTAGQELQRLSATGIEAMTQLQAGTQTAFDSMNSSIVTFMGSLNQMIAALKSAASEASKISISAGGASAGMAYGGILHSTAGGIPVTAAEAGYDEAFIPINRTPRSIGLLAETAARMGFNLFGRNTTGNVNYNPTVIIQGAASEKDVRNALAADREEFFALMDDYFAERGRTSFDFEFAQAY